MMKSIGNTLTRLAFLMIALGATSSAMGAVTAKLDRNNVALGDTLQLTITASESEQLNDLDLQPLLADFEILQRSSSSNTSIINGRRSHTNQLIIMLTPTRQGDLDIPPLHLGQQKTERLPVAVGAPPDIHSGGETVVFEAEVDQDNAYVQSQVILTLRVQQSINLEGRSLSELALENAFVKPLEQNSFQRNIDGRQWLVHEVRYAIFPEQSGTLEIPAQVFSGRVTQGRRSLFDLGRGGKLLRRSSPAITINVLPRPDSYTAPNWLPARRVTLQEKWSTPAEDLRVGESATRSIEILGEGLQGAQLPPILFPPIDGLKYYPDQPQISEREVASGLLGIRKDSAALVPTRAGTFLIPEIRVPWWDTESRQIRYAVIPEREITVAAADPGSSTTPSPSPAPAAENAPISVAAPPQLTPGNSRLWKIISAVSTLGWFMTLLYLWWRRTTISKDVPPPDNTSEKQTFRQLLSACAKGDSAQARAAMIAWSAALSGEAAAHSLDQVASQFGDDRLRRELDILDSSLYSTAQGSWVGTSLAEHVQTLRAQYRKGKSQTSEELKLYP